MIETRSSRIFNIKIKISPWQVVEILWIYDRFCLFLFLFSVFLSLSVSYLPVFSIPFTKFHVQWHSMFPIECSGIIMCPLLCPDINKARVWMDCFCPFSHITLIVNLEATSSVRWWDWYLTNSFVLLKMLWQKKNALTIAVPLGSL